MAFYSGYSFLFVFSERWKKLSHRLPLTISHSKQRKEKISIEMIDPREKGEPKPHEHTKFVMIFRHPE